MNMLSKSPNSVFVGNKPVMSYVLAVITLFSSGVEEVTLKARGRAISTAVDVAEITKRRFMGNLNVSKATIGTEDVVLREGGKRPVSTIEITLTTKGETKESAP